MRWYWYVCKHGTVIPIGIHCLLIAFRRVAIFTRLFFSFPYNTFILVIPLCLHEHSMTQLSYINYIQNCSKIEINSILFIWRQIWSTNSLTNLSSLEENINENSYSKLCSEGINWNVKQGDKPACKHAKFYTKC